MLIFDKYPINKLIFLLKIIVFIAISNNCSEVLVKSSNLENFSEEKNFFYEYKQNQLEEVDRFFDLGKKILKLINLKKTSDSDFFITETSIHFFNYKDEFLEKTKKNSNLNLKKYYYYQITKTGTGRKINNRNLLVEFTNFYTKKVQENSLKELIQKLPQSKIDSKNFFLEKKNLIFKGNNLIFEDEVLYKSKDSSIMISDELNEEFIFSYFEENKMKIFENETNKLELILNEKKIIDFKTENKFEIYEDPLILYKK